MSQQSFDELIEQLPRELTPKKDLWPEIAHQLEQAPSHHAMSTSAWKQFAIACGLLLLGGFGYRLWLPQQENPNDAQMLAMMAQLRQQHEQQVTFIEQHSHFNQWQHASLTAPLSRGVDELRAASAQIYLALQKDPKDQQLWQLWIWSQQREIDLLTQGQQLPERIYAEKKGTRI
ncbi:hypothetical protein KDN34_13145 [Shewanella yunxiaonensis]|uniref:Anti-sigma factor n=1 Tax=Shewanella yunxiaonensis TaxID=2829809 RepID=A0ABX7YQV3_9GAMM|nr:hypothetical protein [Shewanella yunxiaonensis]QUN05139.1 hypothetical protein KDN34_13145 [Shewanella yunxiaonensis]